MSKVTEEQMVKIIDKLVGEQFGSDACLKSFGELQQDLLKRVDRDQVFGTSESEAREKFGEEEDSVFDRVEQHKANRESLMDMYAEQFEKVHSKDHKTFTEKWLFEETGHDIQLEKVLENPCFKDFVGTYDVVPMEAYVASKLIIDESDFMGLYDLGETPSSKQAGNTYAGIDNTSDTHKDDHAEIREHMEARRTSISKQKTAILDEANEEIRRNPDVQPTVPPKVSQEPCACSDAAVRPHALGAGEYLQFRLRKENVEQFMDHSIISSRLHGLIDADSKAQGTGGKEPIYIFTASSNGIMRFHPWGGIQRKLWHGYGDSEHAEAFVTNIVHAGTYGCFCFGIIYKEKENYLDRFGDTQKGGRTIVMRYNRWATDNAPIYAMVRQRMDEQDSSVHSQAGMLEHWKHLVTRRLYHQRYIQVGSETRREGSTCGTCQRCFVQ